MELARMPKDFRHGGVIDQGDTERRYNCTGPIKPALNNSKISELACLLGMAPVFMPLLLYWAVPIRCRAYPNVQIDDRIAN
jgi:hypothetical protein